MNPSNEPADLLRLLDSYYHVHETRKGERYVDCPLCGKPASARQTHFSYSARGGFCFVCQRKVSLHAMCERLHLVEGGRDKYLPAPAYVPKEKVRTAAQWTHNIPALLTRYRSHPRRIELWQAHKPLSRESIQQHGLGVGVLPDCSCKHERLIIPIRQDNVVVNFFGRAITCDCAKWLPPGGAGVTRWLFGIDDLSLSGTIWIVENKAYGNRAYCTLNEGLGKVLRMGAYGPEVIKHLQWMETVLYPVLKETNEIHGPIDLKTMIAQAVQMGDECHNRNKAATSLLIREIAPSILKTSFSNERRTS